MRANTSRALLALTIAASLNGAACAADAPAAAASQPVNAVPPAFATAFNAAQDLLKNGNGAGALAKLKELDALRAPAEYAINDFTNALADFNALVDNPLLPATDKLIMLKSSAGIYYSSEQYAKAAVAIQRYLDAGGDDPQMKSLLTQAQYGAKDYPAAAKSARAEVDADYAAGRVPSEKLLRLLYSAYVGMKDDAGAVTAVEHMAVDYPKAEYWADLISRTREIDNFSDRLVPDYYRLKAQVLGQVDDRERLNYAAITARQGYPIEAKKVLDAAFASQKPFTGTSLADANKLRAEINKAAATDLAQMAANESAARSAKDGNALVGQGLNETLNDNAAKGAELIEQGIAKGGLRAPDEARLHLGYAQIRAGRTADALKTFQAINGGAPGTTQLAHVWILYAQSQLKAPATASK